jgi:hypothetical protein
MKLMEVVDWFWEVGLPGSFSSNAKSLKLSKYANKKGEIAPDPTPTWKSSGASKSSKLTPKSNQKPR